MHGATGRELDWSRHANRHTAKISDVLAGRGEKLRPDVFDGGEDRLGDVLRSAGFEGVRVEDQTVVLTFPDPTTYVQFVAEMSSSIRKVLADQGDEVRERLQRALTMAVEEFAGGSDEVVFENRSICAVGHA